MDEDFWAGRRTSTFSKASQMSTGSCSVRWMRPPHKETCRVTSGGQHSVARSGGAGCWSRLPCGLWAVWGGCGQEPLSAETHGQAVSRVCMLFPPPASAVVLVVSPVAHGGSHTSIAHRAIATTLGMAVGAFHGQFHAIVLLERHRKKAGLERRIRQQPSAPR